MKGDLEVLTKTPGRWAKRQISMKYHFYVEVVYDDESEFHFDVEIEGKEHEVMSTLMKITRGTLMASSGTTAVAYKDDGFPVVSYRQ